MASIKLKGDTSGEVTISAPAVAGTTTLELPATSSTLATQNALGVRNLIINGDMRIDQRNAGSAVTVNANSVFYPVDRFHAVGVASAGVFTAQQVSDSPDGGDKSLKFTVTTASASSGAYRFHYNVEGNHVAHLGFGQSWAKTFTLSFWVKSSVTGTYSGSLRNSAHNRSYVYEYTIDTANTWERKTITITADTTGTWLTDNNSGLKIIWGLSSTAAGTAGSWQSANYFTSTNQTEWIATSGATFYISQIQLEVGDTATPFEHRPYDMELARCQRYYYKTGGSIRYYKNSSNTSAEAYPLGFPVYMRVSPSMSFGTVSTGANTSAYSIAGSSNQSTTVQITANGASGYARLDAQLIADSEL
jgi:hypothetical protein